MHEQHTITIPSAIGSAARLQLDRQANGLVTVIVHSPDNDPKLVIEADQLLIAARTLAELPNLKP